MRTKIKEKIYNAVATTGMNALQSVFPEYFGVDPISPTDRFIEYPWALNAINLYPRDAKVLDVGCAGSMFPILASSIGFDVCGIDIRESFTSGAYYFIKSNICESEFKPDSFRIVTAISTIEHMGLKGYAGAYTDFSAINEIRRILRNDGVFLMTVPFKEKHEVTRFHRFYDNDRLHELFTGWKIVNIVNIQSPEGDYEIALIQAHK